MAATELDRSPDFGNGYKPISRTQGILVETMQLVEPKKSPLPVPNHIIDTKVYSKIAQNDCFQARPAVIHFGGIQIGKKQTQVLKLANVSNEVQRLHIVPPQSKYFSIKYTKQERLVPGLTLDCVVEFTPDEWRYYYDCIRIHSKGEENLSIPIHAYPVMNTDDFPPKITFPAVPVGHRSTRTIPLRCLSPIDFEFQIQLVQPHPAFTVDPLSGVVPAYGQIDIEVSFNPNEFSTAHMKMQLLVSQFNAKPLMCDVTGSSSPGLAKELSELNRETVDSDILDPRSITPVERARKKRQLRKEKTDVSLPTDGDVKKEITRDGIRFPANLDTPYAVAQVLNQQPGKLRIKDVRNAVVVEKNKEPTKMTRQMKEAMFEVALREDLHEERQNQLRWQVKLGEDPMTNKAKEKVLLAREKAWKDYKTKRGDPLEENEYNRSCTKCTYRRTIRDISVQGQEGIKFDPYTNDNWAVRHTALSKFQQAARKIIVRKRAQIRLQSLKDAMIDWSKPRAKSMSPAAGDLEGTPEEQDEINQDTLNLDVARIKSVTFPNYVDPNIKDDMTVDALGVVPVKPTAVTVKKKTPYYDLKVPKHYSLLGYKRHDSHEASLNYVPPRLARNLRTGAEDEIINLPDSALTSVLPAPPSTSAHLIKESDMQLEDVTDTNAAAESKQETATTAEHIILSPPQALFQPIEYPPLHIFNPSPGLQVFQAPLPYAETDSDFHLCPLPRYVNYDPNNPHMATQKKYLDREDTIKGVMSWKKFPSHGLTSLSNTPTLTNVWVPRWNDPFNTDLLPQEVPELYEGLSEEDKALDEEEGDKQQESIQLTPDMVNAMFPSITVPPVDEKAKKDEQEMFPHGNRMPSTNVPVSTTGPVPREKREQELESFIKKKYNRLGNKLEQRINNIDNLKSNRDLVLK